MHRKRGGGHPYRDHEPPNFLYCGSVRLALQVTGDGNIVVDRVQGVDGPWLEAVVLYLDGDGIRHLVTRGDETVRAPWDPDLDPNEVIVDAVANLGLRPFMVHSTSWRVVRQWILLTFLVAVEPPVRVPDACEAELVTRAELARVKR
jgi:hypothetical protein